MKRDGVAVDLGSGKSFFAVDRRTWAVACSLGMNEAVSHLVMARGTGPDMRTTSWSVLAIEKRTRMGRHRAKDAIARLEGAGLHVTTRRGSFPRYKLAPAHEVRGSGVKAPPPLSEVGARLVAVIASETAPLSARVSKEWGGISPRRMAQQLARDGWLTDHGEGYFSVVERDEEAFKPDWIWLPSSLVDGAADEMPPVELVRQSQNVQALRMLVDLYHAQSLARDGGVHWGQIRENYDRIKLCERGQYVVWGFAVRGNQTVTVSAPVAAPIYGKTQGQEEKAANAEFWAALGIIIGLGLAEFVAHLVEADTPSAAVLHPLPDEGTGELRERGITSAALRAALELSPEHVQTRILSEGLLAVPLERHLQKVELIGLLRLRYRAQTQATAEWLEKAGEWDQWATYYDTIAGGVMFPRRHATSKVDQRDFKGTSTGDQRQAYSPYDQRA